jgi:hypothetical protein
VTSPKVKNGTCTASSCSIHWAHTPTGTDGLSTPYVYVLVQVPVSGVAPSPVSESSRGGSKSDSELESDSELRVSKSVSRQSSVGSFTGSVRDASNFTKYSGIYRDRDYPEPRPLSPLHTGYR